MTEKNLSFEEAYRQLEKTVQALEAGGLTLEEALSLYEEGMRLAKICGSKLDAAQLRITQLSASSIIERETEPDEPPF